MSNAAQLDLFPLQTQSLGDRAWPLPNWLPLEQQQALLKPLKLLSDWHMAAHLNNLYLQLQAKGLSS